MIVDSRLGGGWEFFSSPPGPDVQSSSGSHPASYSMGTRCSFPGGKAAGSWSWPFTSICCRGQRVRRAVPVLPQYAFMVWCL